MFSTLRMKFGIPGVISVIALVFAMFGGAYAASNSSGGGKATASAKAKKGPRGPKGATGPAGPAGAQGPAGAKGDTGAAGSNGANGTNGPPGAPGQSVNVASEPPEANCGEQEGVKLTSTSGINYVCNGSEGPEGPKGDPWAAGGTLPSGATEEGTYALSGPEIEGESKLEYPVAVKAVAPISFTVPLAGPLDENHVVFDPISGANPDPTHCPGSAADPKATNGYLCIYEGGGSVTFRFALMPDFSGFGASAAGTVLSFGLVPAGDPPYSLGAWAVTG